MALTEFYALLCRMAKNKFDGKKANRLFAPTLFSHGRKKDDALAHLGLILDFDHTQIPLDKITVSVARPPHSIGRLDYAALWG
jgi:hypothetical protein